MQYAAHSTGNSENTILTRESLLLAYLLVSLGVFEVLRGGMFFNSIYLFILLLFLCRLAAESYY